MADWAWYVGDLLMHPPTTTKHFNPATSVRSLLDSPYITQTHLVSLKGHKRVKLKRKDESSAVIKIEKPM